MTIEETPHERAERILSEEESALDTICGFIENGGSITDLCKNVWRVPYATVSKWIAADSERMKRYDRAKKERMEWSIEAVLSEIKDVALSDKRLIYRDDGTIKDPKDWPEHVAKAVAGIKTREVFNKDGNLVGYTKEVKFWDKNRALELLGKNLKLFVDRFEHSAKESLAELILGSKDDA